LNIKVIFFNNKFYDYYNENAYPEIVRKEYRPYIMLKITISKIDFGIPLRSNINHPHVFWTDEENKSGLDLSKSVVITDASHISNKQPTIRQKEWDIIKKSKHKIKKELENYIIKYKNALEKQHIRTNKLLCKFSTLQYFHDELNIL